MQKYVYIKTFFLNDLDKILYLNDMRSAEKFCDIGSNLVTFDSLYEDLIRINKKRILVFFFTYINFQSYQHFLKRQMG